MVKEKSQKMLGNYEHKYYFLSFNTHFILMEIFFFKAICKESHNQEKREEELHQYSFTNCYCFILH